MADLQRISIHVLDQSQGRPAEGIPVTLEIRGVTGLWKQLGHGRTDADGRSADLYPAGLRMQTGTYRLTFDVTGYFRVRNVASFFPEVLVVFTVQDVTQNYHIPLLLSPFGYSVYRGN
ncbi:MAG: hydroxyisourate hydrolase [Nitrospira sp.]|nr:hydroxyisourate hydrolase [Nitrospira sp.]